MLLGVAGFHNFRAVGNGSDATLGIDRLIHPSLFHVPDPKKEKRTSASHILLSSITFSDSEAAAEAVVVEVVVAAEAVVEAAAGEVVAEAEAAAVVAEAVA